MTAITAVLAFTATPLLAQEASAPVIDAPSPVTAEPAPSISVPSPVSAAPAEPVAPAPRMATQSSPVVNTDDAASEGAGATVAAAVPAEVAAPVRQRASRAAAVAPAPREAAPAVAAATAAAAPVAAPVAPIAAPAPAPAPVETAEASSAAAAPAADNDVLPIAGAVGLGALALAGGAFAYGRRRRRDVFERDEVAYEPVAAPAPVVADPAAAIAPVVATPHESAPAYAAAPIAAPAMAHTADDGRFDLSRYGPHVREAYRGPTPGNPSLNLKRRLKRAMFFDQRARETEQGSRPASLATPAAATRADRWSEQSAGRPSRSPRPTFRPAYQG